jgi:filamentous hemagglutinin family protein
LISGMEIASASRATEKSDKLAKLAAVCRPRTRKRALFWSGNLEKIASVEGRAVMKIEAVQRNSHRLTGSNGASGSSGERRRRHALPPIARAITICLLGAPAIAMAGPLPVNGSFVAGSGSISANGSTMTIGQTTSRGVIDWSQFSIGKGNHVSFLNGNGATLNRVTGGNPSLILGALTATGSVYLINSQGIVVGPGGTVATGGNFVASSLDTCNCAFMKGDPLTFKGTSNASVINLGNIGSTGGDVYLLARSSVVNAGTISAPQGVAGLAAGAGVLLGDASSGQPIFVQTGSSGSVMNMGKIGSAQVTLQAADGNIFAFAGNHASIRATGTATRDGHVWLVADRGSVTLRGPVEARNADGSGGTVDVNASALSLGNAPGESPLVEAKQWNIKAPAFTIDGAAASAFAHSMNAGTSVDVTTTAAPGASGDIDVASSLHWSGASALTLNAYRSLTIEPGAKVSNAGSGSLALRADAASRDNGGSVKNLGTIDWSNSSGTVAAFYDMNGSYAPGTQVSNAAWVATLDSGLRDQITGYALVNSYADLKNVANNLSGNYALGTDIDASASSDGSFVPLGDIYTPFTGQFNGFGHRITQLEVDRTVDADHTPAPYVLEAQGMFGLIGKAGLVSNFSLNASFGSNSGSGPSGFGALMAGVLAGINEGTIVRVDTSAGQGALDRPYDRAFAGTFGDRSYATTFGGLVGRNSGMIYRSSSSISDYDESQAGGLVGDNAAGGTISQSFATGSIYSYGHSNGGGGLAFSNEGTITRSYATGDVSFNPDYCGGASGNPCEAAAAGLVVQNSGTITQSFATGKITEQPPPPPCCLLGSRASAGPLFQSEDDGGETQPPVGIATNNAGTIGNDVYWNKETTGATVGVGTGTPIPAANGLTTAQMSDPASFVGYDFGPNGVWAMPAGATHPVLRWQVDSQ